MNGHSAAYAEAIAISEAYADAAVSAETCESCAAAGIAVAGSFHEIFLQATAAVEFAFAGIADSGDVGASIEIITTSIKEATVVAFAEAIGTARAADGACSGSAAANTVAGVVGGPQSRASCRIDVDAASDYVVSDALVAVTAELGEKACFYGAGVVTSTFSVEAMVCPDSLHRTYRIMH